jgi:hypothetical protein
MRRFAGVLFGWCALTVFAIPVLAHHSFSSEFDSNKRITVSGVISKVEWINPHVYFHVDVKDSKTGKVTTWLFELHSPNSMRRDGLTKAMMPVGMPLKVDGYAAKDGSSFAWANKLSFEDGRTIVTYTPREGEERR